MADKIHQRTKRVLPSGAKPLTHAAVIISSMYLSGHNIGEIVEAVNKVIRRDRYKEVSVKWVRDRLAELRDEWAINSMVNMDQFVAQELARIDMAEAAFWEGWKLSKTISERNNEMILAMHAKRLKNRHEARARAAKQGKRKEFPDDLENETPKLQRFSGDPRFLEGVLNCTKMRMDLLRPALSMTVTANGFGYEQLIEIANTIPLPERQAMGVIEAEFKPTTEEDES